MKKEALDNNDDIEEEIKEETTFYFGESSKTAFERGVLHDQDYVKKTDDSHMWKHVSGAHNDCDPKDIRFGMTVLRSHPSPFHRQVTESVLIYRDQNNLNSRSQYDRCVIPRLSVLIGQRTEKEEEANDNLDNDKALEDIGKERKKRYKGRKKQENETI